MKVTYLQHPVSRTGEQIPVQDVEHGEKFRVVSQNGMYIASYMTNSRNEPDKFKRRDVHLYQLRPSQKKDGEPTWQKCVANFFSDTPPEYRWMSHLRGRGTIKASIIVELY